MTFLSGACTQKEYNEEQYEEDIAEINELREKELEAVLAGNVDSLMAIRTDDFIAMLPGMPAIKGKEAVREVLTGMFGQMEEFEHNTISEEVIVSGDWAFHRGTYTDRVTLKSGGRADARIREIALILQRQEDGSWKYATRRLE
ncbi:MAG: nuclear transport factor 2 family protein [Balneolaceae bacterium]|nr:nuclear transport factor 2 family protein [Balneolaceae bacterium]